MECFKKYTISFVLVTIMFSCSTKKVFNGTAEIECPTYKDPTLEKEKQTTTKYKLILLKDGKRVFGKQKRGKSKLFKKKILN